MTINGMPILEFIGAWAVGVFLWNFIFFPFINARPRLSTAVAYVFLAPIMVVLSPIIVPAFLLSKIQKARRQRATTLAAAE